jgi:peptidoglycan/LPS O-acetylase OafA/YrhL
MGKRIEALQAGRGIAALAVVVLHAHLYNPKYAIFALGVYGVDFFFLLSGFIIYHVYSAREMKLRAYAKSRAIRIFIPYLPIGFASALAYAASHHTGWSWFASLTLLPADSRPALAVAWSLQREMVFYCLAAAFFASRSPLAAAALWAIAIIARHLFSKPLGSVETVVFGWQNVEFVAGMYLARLAPTNLLHRIRAPRALCYMGDASYSIYLAHLPVMAVLWRLGMPPLGLVTIPVGAGILYHHMVEKPGLRWAERLTGERDHASIAANALQVPGVPALTHDQPILPPAEGLTFQQISPT